MAEYEGELNPEPGSTIGATEEYKAAWHAKYGDKEAAEEAAEVAEQAAEAQEQAAKAQAADEKAAKSK